MENILKFVMAFAFFMVLTVEMGDALSCHVCNSGGNYDGASCDDPIKPDQHIKNCDTQTANYTMCRKVYQDVFGETRIVRSCALTGPLKCVDRTGTKGVKVTYCQCKGNTCNTAAAIYQSTVVLAVFSSVSMLFARL